MAGAANNSAAAAESRGRRLYKPTSRDMNEHGCRDLRSSRCAAAKRAQRMAARAESQASALGSGSAKADSLRSYQHVLRDEKRSPPGSRIKSAAAYVSNRKPLPIGRLPCVTPQPMSYPSLRCVRLCTLRTAMNCLRHPAKAELRRSKSSRVSSFSKSSWRTGKRSTSSQFQ